MGIESWEHITEAIENGTENIKVQNMNKEKGQKDCLNNLKKQYIEN
jgi:hypothetical protein